MQGLGVDCVAGIPIHPMLILNHLIHRFWPEYAQHVLLEGMTTGHRQEKEIHFW